MTNSKLSFCSNVSDLLAAKLVGFGFCAPDLFTLGIEAAIPGVHVVGGEFDVVGDTNGSANIGGAAIDGSVAHIASANLFEKNIANRSTKIDKVDGSPQAGRDIAQSRPAGWVGWLKGARSHTLAEGTGRNLQKSLTIRFIRRRSHCLLLI